MKASMRVSIFLQKLNNWVSHFLFVIVLFITPIVEATPSFQKFKNESDSSVHFKLKAIADPASIKPKGLFALYINIEVSAGWHIYSLYAKGVEEQQLATEITFNSDMFVPHGVWEEPTPKIVWDGALERVVKTHEQVVEFRRFYRPIDTISSDFYTIKGSIILRACNNKICNLPLKLSYETQIKILGEEN